jgi:hypothetical protein
MDWNLLLGQMGWSGILAAALVYLFRVYVDALNERIADLEKRANQCEVDRQRLHERIEQLFTQD